MCRCFLPIALVIDICVYGCSGDAAESACSRVIHRALSAFSRCQVCASDHPSMLMHGCLAFGKDWRVAASMGSHRKMSGVEALLSHGTRMGAPILICRGARLLLGQSSAGKPYEVHNGQLAFVLTQIGLPGEEVILATSDRTFNLVDLVELSMKRCREDEGLAWTVPAVVSLKGLDTQWMNDQGTPMSVPGLTDVMMRSSLGDSPCGGTHTLYALAFIYQQDQKEQTLPGELRMRLAEFLNSCLVRAKQQQNSDGSFTLAWTTRKRSESFHGETVLASGHMLEWISMYCSHETLREP